MSIKAEYIIFLSFLLTFAVVSNAFYTKKQFYPSVVYLTKSSSSLAVLYMQAFVFVVIFGRLVQKLFLGQLRAIETEHLYDRAWFSVTETCLAFTVFRDDFSPRFVAFFAVLLFLKCFHWLLEDRVDYMEQSPVLGPVFHARVTSLLSVLFVLDYFFIVLAYSHTMVRGASAQIVFGFEYAILLVSVLSIVMKYVLHSIEIHTGEQWENKGVFMLYSDLILGFFRVTLYVMFMMVMMKIHTFPLFAIRPMFIAMKAFRKSCNDVVESRRAIRNLNTMYPDLTAEELGRVTDTTCIICREEMQVQQSIKRLTCQHIFHKNCLRSWFQRQQTCPICRTTVLRPTVPRAAQGPVPPQPQQQQQHHHQHHQQQQATNAANEVPTAPVGGIPPPPFQYAPFNATSHQGSTLANTSFMPFGSLPMVLPPFAFPPPPLPPLNFTGMSEDAIRAMEEVELAHVQTRLQCLRNVQTLLNASMVQMQQYTNIVTTRSRMENSSHLSQNSSRDSTAGRTSANASNRPVEPNETDLIL